MKRCISLFLPPHTSITLRSRRERNNNTPTPNGVRRDFHLDPFRRAVPPRRDLHQASGPSRHRVTRHGGRRGGRGCHRRKARGCRHGCSRQLRHLLQPQLWRQIRGGEEKETAPPLIRAVFVPPNASPARAASSQIFPIIPRGHSHDGSTHAYETTSASPFFFFFFFL